MSIERNKPSDMQLKKHAFHNQIRRQWLDEHFRKLRNQRNLCLQEKYQKEFNIVKYYNQLFNKLPDADTLDELWSEYEVFQNRPIFLKFCHENYMFVNTKIVQLNIKAYTFFIIVINNIAITYPNSRTMIVAQTLRRLISEGRRLIQQDRLNQTKVLMPLNQLLLVVSDQFSSMNIILMMQICEVLSQSLQIAATIQKKDEQNRQIYMRILMIINQFLRSSLYGQDGQEDQQNVNINLMKDLEYQKTQMVSKMFLQNQNNLKIIINIANQQFQNVKIIQMTLRVLTNLTYVYPDVKLIYKLFEDLLPHLTLTIMMVYPNHRQIMITLTRFINNFMISQQEICKQRIKDIPFKLLVRIFQKQKYQKIDLVEEICSMFANVILFVESQTILQYFIEINVLDVFCYGIQNIKDAQIRFQMYFSFIKLNQCEGQTVREKIRQISKTLEQLQDEDTQQNQQLIRQLLKQAFRIQQTQQIRSHQKQQLEI